MLRKLSLFIMLAALLAPGTLQAQSTHGSPRLMQGPMVGPAKPNQISAWVRTSGNYDCWIEYGTDPSLTNAETTEKLTAQKENDYCLVFTLDDLEPDTTYYYRVYVHDNVAHNFRGVPVFATKTAPAKNAKTTFRVSFGSCAEWRMDPVQPVWQAVQRLDPDLFFWVGDNIYGDALDPDILAEEYRRQRDVLGLQPVIHSVPQLATWDDHDFGLNNHDRTNPVKEGALDVFKQYWPNPSYGLPDVPGVFFKYHYGGVDFFFVDCRYYRDPNEAPDTPDKTMLGEEQLEWLKGELKESEAAFKVLISGSGWTAGKGPGADSWSAFLHERDALFDYIQAEEIEGVLLLSGDTHVGELNCIPRSAVGGYDLYELVSSPLAQDMSGRAFGLIPEMRIRPTYIDAPNAGILDFDFTGEVPVVTMNLISEYGRVVWNGVTVRADELVNGVSSHESKRSDDARAMDLFSQTGRRALEEAGGGN